MRSVLNDADISQLLLRNCSVSLFIWFTEGPYSFTHSVSVFPSIAFAGTLTDAKPINNAIVSVRNFILSFRLSPIHERACHILECGNIRSASGIIPSAAPWPMLTARRRVCVALSAIFSVVLQALHPPLHLEEAEATSGVRDRRYSYRGQLGGESELIGPAVPMHILDGKIRDRKGRNIRKTPNRDGSFGASRQRSKHVTLIWPFAPG
jgi:hypothetical protein